MDLHPVCQFLTLGHVDDRKGLLVLVLVFPMTLEVHLLLDLWFVERASGCLASSWIASRAIL